MNTEQVMKQVTKIRSSLFTGTHDLKAVEGALNELEKLAKVAADAPAKPEPTQATPAKHDDKPTPAPFTPQATPASPKRA